MIQNFLLILLSLLLPGDGCPVVSVLNFKDAVYPLIQERITSPFGARLDPISRKKQFHEGVDLVSVGTPQVLSVYEGTVVYAGLYGSYGNLVVIEHAAGYSSHYAHLSMVAVRVGERIRKGTLIGLIGSSGKATGDHLHFEIRKDGCVIDPTKIFSATGVPAVG